MTPTPYGPWGRHPRSSSPGAGTAPVPALAQCHNHRPRARRVQPGLQPQHDDADASDVNGLFEAAAPRSGAPSSYQAGLCSTTAPGAAAASKDVSGEKICDPLKKSAGSRLCVSGRSGSITDSTPRLTDNSGASNSLLVASMKRHSSNGSSTCTVEPSLVAATPAAAIKLHRFTFECHTRWMAIRQPTYVHAGPDLVPHRQHPNP